MEKILVCKTVVAFPEKPLFLRFHPGPMWTVRESLAELAQHLRETAFYEAAFTRQKQALIKNEAPCDIMCSEEGMLSGRVTELERLSKMEMRELARLLAGGTK